MPEGSAAPTSPPTPETADSLLLARRIVDLVRERRGQDVVLLDVRPLVDYTDFFLLASGQSSRQNQAIAEHVVKTLKTERHYAISKSGLDTGSWICLDMGDVVVHVFDPETRARYDLELLWADAPRVDVDPAPTPAPSTPEEAAPSKRRRVVRRTAVADADAANAPDSERPREDGAPVEDALPAARPTAAPRRGKKAAGKAQGARGVKRAAGKAPARKAPKRKRRED